MDIKKAIIFLNIIALIMSIVWVLFSMLKGIDWFELIFVYFYYILILITLILNLIVLNRKERKIIE